MDIFHTFTSKAFSAMSKKEVKTPLSFFFRVVLAVLLIVLLAMFMMEPNQRMEIFLIGIAVLILLFVGVFTFAWLNPKNLVYGEGSHRAEMKLGFGTETKELTANEIASLPGSQNSKILPPGAM
jgi:hypothetical protein